MATKLKMAGMHTAGIFSDMTVDGPVIGTLVVIVDRAKNLPNRKTIGKQDPYCAARLGKEAKKTETDKRGGQTPRWDQELRFTVHDSPDYYQLKVSVFNDDKRTDLIGETWVNLQDVIVAGGGQSDIWHNLNFKGKYAGEIRVEITYYDKRPKPEKPEKKEPKQNSSTITPSTSVQSITEFGSVSGSGSGNGSLREGVGGPRQLGVKPIVKRRPLPTDPITGAPAQPPVAAPAPAPIPAAIPHPAELVHTPPRGYQAPSTADHVQMTPTRGYRDSPSAIPDHVQTPPRGYQTPPTGIPDHIQTLPQGYKMSPNGMPDHVPRGYANPPVIQDQPSPRGYPSSAVMSDPMQAQRGYHSPVLGQEHSQTPPRGYQNGFAQDQSLVQRVEYNAPSARYNQPQGYDISPGSTPYGAPQDMMVAAPPNSQSMRNNDRYEVHDPMLRNDYENGHDMNQYAAHEADPRDRYGGSRMLTYEPQQPGPYELPMSPGPPPPPPAHASRHVSSVPTLAQPKAVHGRPVSRGNSNPYNASMDDMHRHSLPAHTQPTSAYQAYSPPKNDDQFRRSGNGNPYPPRKNSYDSRDLRYNPSYDDMQPTVEDAPPTPAPGPEPNGYQTAIPHRGSAPGAMQHPAEGTYDQVPAPLNLRHRPSRNSIATTAPSHQYSNSSGGYPTSSSMSSVRDGASVTSRNSYGQLPSSRQDRSQSLGVQNTNGDYGLPEMPPTLVPGMDPIIAKEISDRIYHEKRASYSQTPASSQRGRYQEIPRHQPQQIQQPIPLPYHDNSAVVPYSPQAAYDDRQSRYAASTAMVPVKPRGTSPNPAMDRRGNSPNPMDRRGASPNPPMDRRGASPNPPMDRRGASPNPMNRRGTSPNPAVMRKPVSPAPEPRRLSGIAFGPDSYDVFNPSLTGSKSATSLSAAYDPKDDPDAKIITYDGREIDPSDHIPESNYAPLLEQKGPKYASQMPDRNYRPPPAEHPMPSNGRKQLRQAGRPQSMAVSSPIYFSGGIPDNPPATAHRKLQKKSNRMSAQPAYHSSPNVPIYKEPTYASSRTSMQRPSTAEYSHDSYQSNGYQYGSSPGGGYRGAVGPVVPAKIPMALPAPASSGAGRGGGGGDAWALLEEMKNIDLGAPSSRRRRH